jgi:hypothetical protein
MSYILKVTMQKVFVWFSVEFLILFLQLNANRLPNGYSDGLKGGGPSCDCLQGYDI